MGPLGGRGIEIPSGDAGRGEPRGENRSSCWVPSPRFRTVSAPTWGTRPAPARYGRSSAPQAGRRLVHREGDGAVGTFGHVPALRTLEIGREAAAVEEQDHLLLPGQGAPHALVERLTPGDAAGVGDARRGSEDRPPPPAGGVAHRCGRAASARRCGRCPPGGASRARAWHCRVSGGHPPGGPDRADVAGVIAGRRSLLVAPLMLLVDHDGAQTLDGREDRGAGPDRDPPLPATERPPRVGPFAFRESEWRTATCRRTRRAPAPPSAASARSRERARWRPSLGHDATEHLEVDEGLSRSRHAVDQ